MADANGRRTVGFLVTEDKARKHLTAQLRQRAEKARLRIVLLDPSRPILEQGAFDAIVHKAVGRPEWEQLLLAFRRAHPHVPIIDPPERVRLLHDRSTMLAPLRHGITILAPHDEPSTNGICVTAPAQVTLQPGVTCAEAISSIEAVGVQLPMVAKPLRTGQPGSHNLALVRDLQGLQSLVFEAGPSNLRLPLVLQQFVDHDGVLSKVYVLGSSIVMVQRSSLDAARVSGEGVVSVPRVSKYPSGSTSMPEAGDAEDTAPAPQPPEWLVRGLTRELQHETGLQLFNYDLIRTTSAAGQGTEGGQYQVIDINFYPGFEKLPDFEDVMIGFLRAVVDGEKAGGGFGQPSFRSDSQLRR